MLARARFEIGFALGWSLLASGVACFNPQINEGKRCGPDDSCPPGFPCGEDQVCRSELVTKDGSVVDAILPDAGSNDAFTLIDASVPSTPHITLFAHPPVQGDFGVGGRVVIDDLCGNLAAQMVERCTPIGSSYFGFVSIDSTDSIVRMPENFGVPDNLPVLSAGGVVIAETFADMFENNVAILKVSLAAAGVLPPDTLWWSGSEANGELSGGNCLGWTETEEGGASTVGSVGASDDRDQSWIAAGIATCDSRVPFLCICYPP